MITKPLKDTEFTYIRSLLSKTQFTKWFQIAVFELNKTIWQDFFGIFVIFLIMDNLFGTLFYVFELKQREMLYRAFKRTCTTDRAALKHSVRPKPLFWFRSDTETQIGQYFWADTVTDTETRFQGKNPGTNFLHHQRAPIKSL